MVSLLDILRPLKPMTTQERLLITRKDLSNKILQQAAEKERKKVEAERHAIKVANPQLSAITTPSLTEQPIPFLRSLQSPQSRARGEKSKFLQSELGAALRGERGRDPKEINREISRLSFERGVPVFGLLGGTKLIKGKDAIINLLGKIGNALKSNKAKLTPELIKQITDLPTEQIGKLNLKRFGFSESQEAIVKTQLEKGGPKAKVTIPQLEKSISRGEQITPQSIIDVSDQILKSPTAVSFSDEFLAKANDLYLASVKKLDTLSKSVAKDPKNTTFSARYTEELANNYELTVAVENLAASRGRSLSFLRRKPQTTDELMRKATAKVLRSLPKSEALKVNQLIREAGGDVDKIKKVISDYTKSTWRQKITEYRINALLSNPKTHLRNIMGTSINVMARLARMPIEAALEVPRAAITGQPRQIFFKEIPAAASGVVSGLGRASKGLIQDLASIAKGKEISPVKGEELRFFPSIKGIKGSAVRVPTKLLSVEDRFFRNLVTEIETKRFKVREMEGVLKGNIDELVQKEVQETLFQADLPGIARDIGKALNADTNTAFAFKTLFPFWKTPMNLVIEGFRHSPGGLLEAAFKVRSPEASKQAAKSLLGILVSLPIISWALGEGPNGEPNMIGSFPITKGEAEKEEFRRLYQENSIRIGNEYVSFRDLEPFTSYFSAIAAAAEQYKRTGNVEDGLFSATTAFGRSIADKSSMLSFKKIIDALFSPPTEETLQEALTKKGGRLSRMGSDLVASFIPNVIQSIARGQETTYQRPEGLLETLKTRIPGFPDEDIPVSRDVFGRPSERRGGLPEALLNVFSRKPIERTPLEQELVNLGIRLKPVSRTIEGFKLSDRQRDEINQIRGPKIEAGLNVIRESPVWSTLSPAMKERVINQAEKLINESANIEYLVKNKNTIFKDFFKDRKNLIKFLSMAEKVTQEGASMTEEQLNQYVVRNLDQLKTKYGIQNTP